MSPLTAAPPVGHHGRARYARVPGWYRGYSGLGDTIRISLTADPVEEVRVARLLLKSLDHKFRGATLTSCPTFGRCSVAMIPIAERVEQRLSTVKGEVSVAVMGCEVNGPGGVGLPFKAGQILKRMKAEDLEDAVVVEALRIAAERALADVK